MGTAGHILEKKGRHFLREKKETFFSFSRKQGSIFSVIRGTFYASLVLMYETP